MKKLLIIVFVLFVGCTHIPKKWGPLEVEMKTVTYTEKIIRGTYSIEKRRIHVTTKKYADGKYITETKVYRERIVCDENGCVTTTQEDYDGKKYLGKS